MSCGQNHKHTEKHTSSTLFHMEEIQEREGLFALMLRLSFLENEHHYSWSLRCLPSKLPGNQTTLCWLRAWKVKKTLAKVMIRAWLKEQRRFIFSNMTSIRAVCPCVESYLIVDVSPKYFFHFSASEQSSVCLYHPCWYHQHRTEK